jgi:4-amino-4-deoxy-L-arabinose transferase-like glycosyltransferase
MSVEKGTHWALLVLLLLGAFALRVHYLSHDRFHADEALYAGWALRILDDDPLLLDEPVDKPPLYLYLLAGSMRLFGTSEVAARWPNLAASMLNVALLYRLACRLYDQRVGHWAAFTLACSPYAVLFARTAFTDPLLVTWILAALNAVARGDRIPVRSRGVPCPAAAFGRYPPVRIFWVGLCAGLAFATKQHAIFLLPLILGLAWAVRLAGSFRLWPLLRGILLALLGFALPYALVTWWDAQRWAIRPGFWQQSAQSYGGLRWAPIDEWGSRLVEWASWARYLVGSPLLYVLLVLGSAMLLVRGWWRMRGRQASLPAVPPTARTDPAERSVRLDRLWAGYGVAYLIAHTILGFSIWDRYLLPLAPLASMLLARIVVGGQRWLRAREQAAGKPVPAALVASGAAKGEGLAGRLSWRRSWPRYAATAWAIVLCAAALFSGARAARNGYPVGGEHWAYQGLEEIVAYLKAHALPDAVLYHHWLRWHYTYYLHDTEIELRYWQSGEHLQREAARAPERAQYIVLPDWYSFGLQVEGVVLESLYEAHREDGNISLRLYRVSVK